MISFNLDFHHHSLKTEAYQNLGLSARAYQMNADFSRVIEEQLQLFHASQETPDRIAEINVEISKTKQVGTSALNFSSSHHMAASSLFRWFHHPSFNIQWHVSVAYHF